MVGISLFSPLGFSLPPVCRKLSLLFAEEGCRFPSIHALHAANMEPVWWFLRTIIFWWFCGWHFSFFPTGFFFSPSSLQESVTPVCLRRLQVSFDPCFARCNHGTCSVVLRTIIFRWFCGWYFSFFSTGVYSLPPVCRNLSLLLIDILLIDAFDLN